MLVKFGRAIREWTTVQTPWTNVYGVARTLLASATLLTLVANPSTVLFRPIATVPGPEPYCSVVLQKAGIFCLLSQHTELARFLSVAILAVVASGWRPALTGILHWWVAVSFQASASVVDGGDQAVVALTLLMLPLTLTDPRAWHWSAAPSAVRWAAPRKLLAASALLAVRVQVCAIYFHAAVGKMMVPEWADGTALYYWFTHPMFGANPVFRPLLDPLLTNGTGVTMLTWSVIVLELLLTTGLVATRSVRKFLLPAGLLFHSGIILIHGLVSFALTMFGALVVYLRPADDVFSLPHFHWARPPAVPRLARDQSHLVADHADFTEA